MAFEFAYNDPKYSDRKLRLVIISDSQPQDHDSENLGRAHKRRRRNVDSAETSHPGSAPAGEQYEELYVNTLLLAKESTFFRRIFDGACFKEAFDKVIDIQLSPDEKQPFIDLLKYMYSTELEADTAERLVRIWQLSQRFMVNSCVDLCMEKLKILPLSLETSCYFLELAPVANQTEEFKHLLEKSISFLVNHFQVSMVMNGENPGRWTNIEDFKQLSAHVLESLLKSDDLQVVHEESVYHAVRTWIKTNCKGKEEEIDAWKTFGPLIRWPVMETSRVKAIFGKIDCDEVAKLLIEALLYQISSDEEKKSIENTSNDRYRRRARHAVPVKFLSTTLPINHGLIFFNLSMKEWIYLQKSNGPVCTERFHLGGCIFIWLVQVRTFNVSDKRRVSILLVALNAPPSSVRVDISLSIWDARTSTYIQRYKGVHSLRKDVRERIAMCLDCFGKDIDKIVPESEFVYRDATWFRTEVQVEWVDQLT